jgi:hypothetical protein
LAAPALGVLLAPAAFAQDDDEEPEGPDLSC